jgi:hypothetical protein
MKKRFALAALLAVAPFATPAQGMSYSYVEGGYDRADIEEEFGDDTEVDGAYVGGSIEIGSRFHLFGRYAKLTGEDGFASLSGGHTFDTDFETGELGLGYHHGLGDQFDLIAELSLLSQRVETTRTTRPFFGDPTPYAVTVRDQSSNASRFALGLRGSMDDRLEGWAKAGYLGGGDFEGGFSATLGTQVKLGRTWGVVAELEFAESWNQYRVGVRASF